ncbi:MAG: Smr/MutS family protein [Ruminiclostridium sp.]|nr:Smr/MutS family protein [Ruminiclostridium sp.]
MDDKIKTMNLEDGYPSSDEAIRKMTDGITSSRQQGYKAVLLIHGYGSMGQGGAIRTAVSCKLKDRSMCGLVRAVCPGEEWNIKKRQMLDLCPRLKDYEREIILSDRGVTVVLLK